MKNKLSKRKAIDITTNDADILATVANSTALPEIAKEMIAVRCGTDKEEGIISRKVKFERFLNDERWSILTEKDKRWQRDIMLECSAFAMEYVKLYLKADFMLIDDASNTVSVVVSDFSSLSEREIKKAYTMRVFLISEIAKRLWEKSKINCYVLHYDSRFNEYEYETWQYEPERSSCFQIKGISIQFSIEKALDIVNSYISVATEYMPKSIPFYDLPVEAQKTIDDIKFFQLNIRLAMEALERIDNLYEYNKRRIRCYMEEDETFRSLKEQMDCLYSDFSKWYTILMKSR